MSELKVHRFITTDELFTEANAGSLYYDKSAADKVIARWCAEAYNRECGLNPEEMTDKEFYKQQIEFWPRWNSKWLKIAEKFKPNSTSK